MTLCILFLSEMLNYNDSISMYVNNLYNVFYPSAYTCNTLLYTITIIIPVSFKFIAYISARN